MHAELRRPQAALSLILVSKLHAETNVEPKLSLGTKRNVQPRSAWESHKHPQAQPWHKCHLLTGQAFQPGTVHQACGYEN